MRKYLLPLALLALATGLAFTATADHHEGSWTGEVLDLACYVGQGAKGDDHADCAKKCVEMGQPMGLLTDDGTVVLLAADHKNGEAYENLKAHAGHKVTVMGSLAERDGMKIVTVTGAKAM